MIIKLLVGMVFLFCLSFSFFKNYKTNQNYYKKCLMLSLEMTVVAVITELLMGEFTLTTAVIMIIALTIVYVNIFIPMIFKETDENKHYSYFQMYYKIAILSSGLIGIFYMINKLF